MRPGVVCGEVDRVRWSAARFGLVGRLGVGCRWWLVLLAVAGLVAVGVVAVVQPSAGSRSAGRAAGGLARAGVLPLRARSAISTAIGSGVPVFAARRSAGGYRLSGGGVRARFDRSGPVLWSGAGSLSFGSLMVGRGRRLDRLAVRSLVAHGNRVVYRRGGASEWYAAGPLGIEQGFTVARRPAGGSGKVVVALRFGDSLRARSSGSGVRFVTASGRVAFRYGGPSAVDARGRPLPVALSVHGGALLLRVSDVGARYPLRIDPLVQQGPNLPLVGNPQNGPCSTSVAWSADGNTALVGCTAGIGGAWVFTRSGSTWTQQGPKLTGSDEIGQSSFGDSVALSADGNTALIGGLGDDGDHGAAWVFTRSGSTWTQQGPKLTGSGEIPDSTLGWSVALSADGDTALLGGRDDNDFAGAAWVFTRSGSTWTQQGPKLTVSDENDQGGFGTSVALSADGDIAVIGAPQAGPTASRPGRVFVFSRSGSTWSQQGPGLTPGDPIDFGLFGISVALSGDGNTALIGGQGDDVAAWVFTRLGSTWSQQGSKIVPTGAIAGFSGGSVALSSDGNTALLGDRLDDNNLGAVWVFTRSGSAWSQQGQRTPGAPGDGNFGLAMAVSPDGNSALISAANRVAVYRMTKASTPTPPPGSTPTTPTRPASGALPLITGTPKAGRRLSCSTGKWANKPTRFTYQWSRDATPIIGATKHTYSVRASDQGLTLRCTVTASNQAGAGRPATSAGVLVKVPFVAHCPAATGRLRGRTLGLLRLGMTRSQARRKYVRSSTRGRTYQDFFCLTPIGVRAGYASPAVVTRLPRGTRKRFAGRVIWASTHSAYYAVRGVRAGATVKAAGQRLKLEPPFQVGLNTWYLAPNGPSIAVLKVRHGMVEEIGIGAKSLTKGRKAQLRFLKSFT
jgi:FG-GAP repeat